MRLASTLSKPAPALSPAEQPGTYLALYGLSKPPFDAAGECRFYMLFNAHRPAFERLVSHMLNGSGFALLLGEDGSGKSMMVDAAAQVAADAGLRILRPADGRIDEAALMAAIEDEDGAMKDDAGGVLDTPRPVLLMDDAERLTPAAWAVVTALLRPQTGRLAIVATMNPASEASAEPAHLDIQIPGLAGAEIRQYIERSLWRAGGTTRRLIAPDAMRMIVSASSGRPGNVNRLMEGVFTAGFVRGDPKITARTVAAVLPPHRRGRHQGWTDGMLPPVFAAGLLVIGLSAFVYKGLAGGDTRPDARPALERAADAGDAGAATEAGKTFDPGFGASPADTAQAAAWYRKAIALGDPRASVLLRRLLAQAGDKGSGQN